MPSAANLETPMANSIKSIHPLSLVGAVFIIAGIIWFATGRIAIGASQTTVGLVFVIIGAAKRKSGMPKSPTT